jgi:hypothetical protein
MGGSLARRRRPVRAPVRHEREAIARDGTRPTAGLFGLGQRLWLGHRGVSSDRALLLAREAVAQTPGEPARPFLRLASENGHLVRRACVVRREVVPHVCSSVSFRKRAAAFPRRLYATASRGSGSRDSEPQTARARPAGWS